MKTAIYVRVSTDKQEVENQLQPLLDFANKRGLEVYKIYKDIATGKSSNREEFNIMISEAHQKKFDAILVWSLDRLSREGMVKTVYLLEHLSNIGVNVISYTEPYLDTSNELARNILLAVVSTLAKAERERISERTKAGLERLKKQGKKLGRPPIPENTREEIVKLRKEKLSLREIGETLGVSHTLVSQVLNGVNKRGVKNSISVSSAK